ncbi:hypothetical protein OG884_04490 [Streptosporangium sp. NBC_01755]|uniref:hypothetical protein n=1 Tax=unclassified Streptosporangium TaxID=2632669 RepID=UPI002DD8D62A|nr:MULTISPECIES: hypothetical protein [unclassified Streptosporangium]WSA27248.1 hypothetical protein OIE13_05040 [Streptosporangium sp. NBC_01810]WSD01199.1 hypothetical protein OG884_04490 [Streptosporangium sp. NBC_01755]
MMTIRSLTGLALAAVLISITPAAAQAATGPAGEGTTAARSATQGTIQWSTKYAPGRKAKTHGSLTVSGEDHADIPAAATSRISGKVYDLTKGSSCGWAVFRLTYRTAGGNLPFKHHSVVDCSYGTPKSFAFTQRNLYQLELKVCSGAKASKPSVNCLYAGSWKVLYVSK